MYSIDGLGRVCPLVDNEEEIYNHRSLGEEPLT